MSTPSLHDRIKAIPPVLLICDMRGSPVDEYIAKWRVLEIALEADAVRDEMLAELMEIREWAVKEKAPLRHQEIDSITRLINKATKEPQ